MFGQHRYVEARNLLLSQVEKQPKDYSSLTLLGEVYCALGDAPAAVDVLQKALDIAPDHGLAWYLMGVAHYVTSRLTDAESALRHSAEDTENRERSLRLLAHIYFLSGQLPLAADAYRKLLADTPGNLVVWRDLVQVLHKQNKLDTIIEEIDQARVTALPSTVVELTDALLLPKIYQTSDEVGKWRARAETRLASIEADLPPLSAEHLDSVPSHFPFAYQGGNDREIMSRLGSMYRRMCPDLSFQAPHIDTWRGPQGRVHLGIYSAFLRSHTIGKLNFGLVKYLDRKRFKVTLFVPINEQKDAFAEQFKAVADEVVSLPENYAITCDAIAKYRLDALLYPDIGMHRLTYFLAHARLAPLQMTSWGHPVTTGIPTIDEFLSSDLLESDEGESHYSEKLVRFSRLPSCYQRYFLPTLKSREALGLPHDRHLYFCPQSLFKIQPDFDQALRAILDRDPSSEILFLNGEDASWKQALVERLGHSLGASKNRVRFIPRIGLTDFLSVIKSVDAVLDPFHFGGGNTHYETFMLGSPVVTLPGEFMRGRVGHGCYRQLGVTDLVARDVQHYVDLAIQTASDKAFREDVCERIIANGDALYHDLVWVREFEDHVISSLAQRI